MLQLEGGDPGSLSCTAAGTQKLFLISCCLILGALADERPLTSVDQKALEAPRDKAYCGN